MYSSNEKKRYRIKGYDSIVVNFYLSVDFGVSANHSTGTECTHSDIRF